MKKLVFLTIILMVLVGACAPNPALPGQNQPVAAEATKVAKSPPSVPDAAAPTATPVPSMPTSTATATDKPAPTATPAPTNTPPPTATSAPTATPAPVFNCNGATVLRELAYDVLKDEADGDPFNYWVNVAGKTSGKPEFLVLGEPMLSVDFEALEIHGTSYRLEANSLADAVCVANTLAKAAGIKVKVYLGSKDAPEGYTKDLLKNWKMRVSSYAAKPIDPGGKWTEVPVSPDSSSRTYRTDPGEFFYVQLWNPAFPGKATHVIVAPNYNFTVAPNYQGTGWTNIGGENTLLLQRFAQATSEVFLRDEHPVITKLWCGPPGGPMGWESTMSPGFACAK